MATTQRNFIQGKMNKELNERLIPNGVYVDATNVTIMSEGSGEDGVVQNTQGNEQLTSIEFDGVVPTNAVCIGSFEDSSNEVIYWFVTADFSGGQNSGKIDFILSYNTVHKNITYHVVSTQSNVNTSETTLNFNKEYRMNGINLVDGLLFFTDGYNPPRKINVKRTYAHPTAGDGYMDSVDAKEFMVIKAPPSSAPSVEGLTIESEDEFMKDKFISFAYRYKYNDGEYSATSQFSQPVFGAKPFDLISSTVENIGAENVYNAANVVYNSGDSSVTKIEILYKESNDNIIKIADSIDKDTAAVVDDTDYTYVFNGSKTYTLLNSAEILRLYDNVPHTAKAQTVMSNRLVYGNYTEGFEMQNKNGVPISVDYNTYISHEVQGFDDVPATIGNQPAAYTIGGFSETNIPGRFKMDFTGLELKAGMTLAIDVTVGSDPTTSNGTIGDDMPQTDISFSYELRQDFSHPDLLAWDPDFRAKIGTLASISPVYNPADPASEDTSCNGNTFTDIYNCAVPAESDGKFLYATGQYADNTPIYIESSWTDQFIYLTFPAMHYVDDLATPTVHGYDYPKVSAATATLIREGNGQSLHSSRGYEVAMIYMDEFGRSTTPQVSDGSNASTVAADSTTVNKLNVSIPPIQAAPFWATKFKFVAKQNTMDYDTVYSQVYFREGGTANTWFYLEGENAAKVEKGDKLLVKMDVNGSTDKTIEVTVLDKTVEEENFKDSFVDEQGNSLTPPSGVYMKINSSKFATLIADGGANEIEVIPGKSLGWHIDQEQQYPTALIGPFGEVIDGQYVPFAIEGGSRITTNFNFKRRGTADGNNLCEKRIYDLEQTLTASRDFPDFQTWWVADDIKSTLNSGSGDVGLNGADVENEMYVDNYIMTQQDYDSGQFGYDVVKNYYQFIYHEIDGHPGVDGVYLAVRGTKACGSSLKKRSTVDAYVSIQGIGGAIAFETKPKETLEDIWFENEQSFPITSGLHTGNIQNQDSVNPAICQLTFSNCISFGNGVESMKINDSIIGSSMSLGHRVHSTVEKNQVIAHRYADLTYSGVINDESNINRLNEFNGGLLNFKACEDSFGPIEVIDARRTDILVLQEDKISVVMAGKNLLSMSDSVEGGALMSVPDVLGQQVARAEDFGISNNPESYVSYGSLKYFTDVKRGAVLCMQGEQLKNIANDGMATYFKNSFLEDSATYKLGGFDPYSNEYILHNSDEGSGENELTVECGTEMQINLIAGEEFSFNIEYGANTGDVFNIINIPAGATVTGEVYYKNILQDSFTQAGTSVASLDFTKSVRRTTHAEMRFTSDVDTTITVTLPCQVQPTFTVRQVVITDNGITGDTIRAEYNTTRAGYISVTQSTPVQFLSNETTDPVVSLYNTHTGDEGTGSIPLGGDTINVGVRQGQFETFEFDASQHSISALKTTQDMDPTDVAHVGILLSTSTPLASITQSTDSNGDTLNSGSFILSSTTNEDYLYLVYDLRSFSSAWLSYDASTVEGACCNQLCDSGTCGTYHCINELPSSAVFDYVDCAGANQVVSIPSGTGSDVCSLTPPVPQTSSSKITVTLTDCNC